jgi:hypothetical protein
MDSNCSVDHTILPACNNVVDVALGQVLNVNGGGWQLGDKQTARLVEKRGDFTLRAWAFTGIEEAAEYCGYVHNWEMRFVICLRVMGFESVSRILLRRLDTSR